MVTLKIDSGDKMEVLGESFVWLRHDQLRTDNLYIDLCDLPTIDGDAIRNIRDRIVSLTEELTDHLLTLSRLENNEQTSR